MDDRWRDVSRRPLDSGAATVLMVIVDHPTSSRMKSERAFCFTKGPGVRPCFTKLCFASVRKDVSWWWSKITIFRDALPSKNGVRVRDGNTPFLRAYSILSGGRTSFGFLREAGNVDSGKLCSLCNTPFPLRTAVNLLAVAPHLMLVDGDRRSPWRVLTFTSAWMEIKSHHHHHLLWWSAHRGYARLEEHAVTPTESLSSFSKTP